MAGCSDAQRVSEQCESPPSHHKWYLLMLNLFFNTAQIPGYVDLGVLMHRIALAPAGFGVFMYYAFKKAFIHPFIPSSSVC